MVNDSTLKVLNKIGTGLNANAIEQYIANYEAIRYISNNSDAYLCNYEVLKDILREIKPSSRVFVVNDKTYTVDNMSKAIFDIGDNSSDTTIFGKIEQEKLESLEQETFNSDSDVIDIVGIEEPNGIDVSITYVQGKLHKIYSVKDSTDLMEEITELFKGITGIEDELHSTYNCEVVNIRGVIKSKDGNTLSIGNILRLNENSDRSDYEFLATDLFLINTEDTQMSTMLTDETKHYWNKLRTLKDEGFNIPKYSLVRNVDSGKFITAIHRIAEQFKEQSIKKFKVKNIRDTSNRVILVYDLYNVGDNYRFESVVTGIHVDEESCSLKIVDTKCNELLTIDEIEVSDLYTIEKCKVALGKKVRFKIINHQAELVSIDT